MICDHWAGCEIRNHWRKDTCLFLDKTRSRNPHLVVKLMFLRNLALHFYVHHGCLLPKPQRFHVDNGHTPPNLLSTCFTPPILSHKMTVLPNALLANNVVCHTGNLILEHCRPMKTLLKSLLITTHLRHFWNRFLAGNQIRIQGQNNKTHMGSSLLTCTTICIQGNGNTLVVGDRCRLHDLKIMIIGESLRVEICDNCQLRGKIKVEDQGGLISIGSGTTMENTYLGAYEGTKILIGKDCMFSDQVGIRTGDMHSIVNANSQERLNPSCNITIGPHVWLCRGVTILKGCTIGANAVIGGYSVVTASLPPGVLASGSPAKIIRDNITWRRERLQCIPKSSES